MLALLPWIPSLFSVFLRCIHFVVTSTSAKRPLLGVFLFTRRRCLDTHTHILSRTGNGLSSSDALFFRSYEISQNWYLKIEISLVILFCWNNMNRIVFTVSQLNKANEKKHKVLSFYLCLSLYTGTFFCPHFITIMNLIILYLVGVIIVLKKSFFTSFREFFFQLDSVEYGSS